MDAVVLAVFLVVMAVLKIALDSYSVATEGWGEWGQPAAWPRRCFLLTQSQPFWIPAAEQRPISGLLQTQILAKHFDHPQVYYGVIWYSDNSDIYIYYTYIYIIPSSLQQTNTRQVLSIASTGKWIYSKYMVYVMPFSPLNNASSTICQSMSKSLNDGLKRVHRLHRWPIVARNF